MQFRSIIRIVGLLLALFSVTMLAPALVALIYRDGAGVPFVTTFFVLLFCGAVCWYPNRRYKHELKARDGFLSSSYSGQYLAVQARSPFSLLTTRTSQ